MDSKRNKGNKKEQMRDLIVRSWKRPNKQSLKDFCNENEISTSKYYYWCGKFDDLEEEISENKEVTANSLMRMDEESIRRSEIYVACKENSIWAQYIIEFFKFVGFCVSKASTGDLASVDAVGKEIKKFFSIGKLNLKLINDTGEEVLNEDKVTIQSVGSISVIYAHCNEEDFNDTARMYLLGSILDRIRQLKYYDNEDDIETLKYLLNLYEQNGLFWHLYNEGLLKSFQDYYNASDETNNIKQKVDDACKESKKDFAACINALFESDDDGSYKSSRYTRYVEVLLAYKLNELKQVIEGKNIFSPEKLLGEMRGLTTDYPYFIRAYYLAAQICRNDLLIKNQAISNIYKAIGQISGSQKVESFLYYQLAKFYEEYDYDINEIKNNYKKAKENDDDNCLALYKYARCLHDTGKKPEAVQELKILEDRLVDALNKEKIMPKRRINGYKCCVLLASIEYELDNYEESEKYYKKALELAIRECRFFKPLNQEDTRRLKGWDKVFYSCMPLTPISNVLMHIYRRKEEGRKYTALRGLLLNGHEEELQNFWKKELGIN